jgi:hypothetical protein
LDTTTTAKRRNANADTSDADQEIDQLVYALYKLTPEEIAIVEGRSPSAKRTPATAKPVKTAAAKKPRKSVMSEDPDLS